MSILKKIITSSIICTFIVCISVARSNAATITAESCSMADVQAAYNSSSDGDTVLVPSGNCLWTSSITINKKITLQGAGISNTTIGIAGQYSAFIVPTDNVRITKFNFDCNNSLLTGVGIVRLNTSKDFRLDHNQFTECTKASTGSTGYYAIYISGYSYGVIDNNTFDNCNSECITYCSDSLTSLGRSIAYGQYTNGTIYIEDNTWNYSNGVTAENAIEGNSGSRYVVRHNTFNFTNGTQAWGLVSTHETCVYCEGSLGTGGDVGSLLMEIYENDIYLDRSNTIAFLATQRGGRSLIYNNRYHNYDDLNGASIVKLSSYRSTNYGNGTCTVQEPRGYSSWCHDFESGLASEGRLFSKTTLAGSIDSAVTSISVASVTDFPTYGGSIIVGSEQIDYTGISGTTLTGCTRGANSTTTASHSVSTNIDLLVFGTCMEQPNNTYVWGNTSPSGDKNNVWVITGYRGLPNHNDYSSYDIQSYSQRPANWQYRSDGTAYSYTPYPYPHQLATPPEKPTGLSD